MVWGEKVSCPNTVHFDFFFKRREELRRHDKSVMHKAAVVSLRINGTMISCYYMYMVERVEFFLFTLFHNHIKNELCLNIAE